MSHRAVLITSIVVLSLVVPTAAVALDQSASRTDATGYLSLESTSPYASTDGDELELDFDRINDRAVTETHEVFEITATDDRLEAVWLSHEVDGITFYENGDPSAEIDKSNPLHLAAGETATIGVSIDTRVASSSRETFTVHARVADDHRSSDITLERVSVSQTDLTVGENLTVTATYENRGNATGAHTAELVVDGVVVDQQRVVVKPDKTRTVTFERSMNQVGTFELGVDDHPSRIITVRKSDEPAPAFAVSNATLEADTITAGESVAGSATVENRGNATGTMTVELAVGEYVVDTRRIELGSNESTTVAFEWRFDEPGTYDVAVSGTEAGTVTVTGPRAFSTGIRNLMAPSAVAVAPPLTVGALLLITAVNRRRDLWPVWHSDEPDP